MNDSLAWKITSEFLHEQKEKKERDARLKKTGESFDPAQVASLRERARLAGEAVVVAEEELREAEQTYKEIHEGNIQANKTFAHLFLRKMPLDIAEDEEKEAAERVKEAKAEYDRLVEERKEAQDALKEAQPARRALPEEVLVEPLPERELKPAEKKIKKYLDQFRISQEEFENIPGIEKLTDGQKALVLENLGQLTVGRIQAEAYDQVDKKIASSKWLKKAWVNVSKQYRIANAEKKTGKEIMAGRLETHREVLEKLIQGAEHGPDARVDREGKIEIMFLAPQHLNNVTLSSAERTEVEKFNEAASAYAQMPADWNSVHAKNSERKQYKEIATRYREAKMGIAKILVRAEGEKEGYMGLHNLEMRVVMNQYLNTHPDVEKALQNIEDEKVWTKTFKDMWAERGLIMAGGFALRSATLGVMSTGVATVALPALGAGVGGAMGLRRSFDALRRADRAMRRGGKANVTPEDTMQNRFVRAKSQIQTVTLVNKKTGKVLTEEEAAVMKKKKGWQKLVEEKRETTAGYEPKTLTSKLDDLIMQVEAAQLLPANARVHKKRDPLLKDKVQTRQEIINTAASRLKARLEYTQKKLEAGLVSLGESQAERIVNIEELTVALTKAELLLRLYEGYYKGKEKKNPEERLEEWLGIRKKEAESAKNKYIAWETGKGFVFGAAFAYAGKEFAEWFWDTKTGKGISERWHGSSGSSAVESGGPTASEVRFEDLPKPLQDEIIARNRQAGLEYFHAKTEAERLSIREGTLLSHNDLIRYGNEARLAGGGEALLKELESLSGEERARRMTDLAAGNQYRLQGIVTEGYSREQLAQLAKEEQLMLEARKAGEGVSAIEGERQVTEMPPQPPVQSSTVRMPIIVEESRDPGADQPKVGEKPAIPPSVSEGVVPVPGDIIAHLEGYKIQRGDSMWKIIGRELPENLEGRNQKIASLINLIGEKNPDIDVDKIYADKTFSLSTYGITENDVKEILDGKIIPRSGGEDLAALAERIGRERVPVMERMTPITDDEIIPEPGVSDTAPASSSSAPSGGGEASSLGPFPGTEVLEPSRRFDGNILAESDADSRAVHASVTEETERGSRNAKLSFEPARDIQLGKAYNKEAYADFFRENPRALTQYYNLSRQYFNYIGGGDEATVRRIRIKDFTTLGSVSHLQASSDPTEVRLGELAGQAREIFGKVAIPKKSEHVIEYVSRLIMMSLEHPRGTTLKIPQYA